MNVVKYVDNLKADHLSTVKQKCGLSVDARAKEVILVYINQNLLACCDGEYDDSLIPSRNETSLTVLHSCIS